MKKLILPAAIGLCALALALNASADKTTAAASAPPQPNSQMKVVLDELASKGGMPIETLTPDKARKQPTPTDAVMSVMKKNKIKPDKTGFAKIYNEKITGFNGKVPARFYITDGAQPKPVIVYFHGGGWVIANNDVYDSSIRALGKQTGAIIVAVDYREGPEYRFPVAHNDAFEAYKWVLANAKSFGGDPSKVAVAGESAGGNLAINVSIRARDEKIQTPIYQLLVYPVAGNNMETASYKENAQAKPLNKPMIPWFLKNYLNSPEEAKDTRINVLAANLKGLPPTTVITAQIDPLRSEGQELAEKLKANGVQVSYKNYDGVTHEFFGMGPVLDQAKDAEAFAATGLKTVF